MSVSVTPRRFGRSRVLWRLRRPYHWSWPPGWGWEGPDATGHTMTRHGAYRAIRRAERSAALPGSGASSDA